MDDKQILETFATLDTKVKSIDEKIAQNNKLINDRLAKALEQLTTKEDLGPYMHMSAKDIYVAQTKRSCIEKLQAFRNSDFGKMTVKELLTSTSNVALPTMVQTRAILELTGNWMDAREICMQIDVPKGSGKTINTQVIAMPAYDSWTEGSALSAADPTLTTRSITLAPFGKVTQISDLLANTSAINFVDMLGQVHGACVRQGIFTKVMVAISAGAGGTISAASSSTLTFTDVRKAIKTVANAGVSPPDFIVTSPSNAWTAFSTSDAMTQYYGALNDIMASGIGKVIHNVLGLDWYLDPYWDTVFPAANKVLAYVGCKGISAVWGALQTDPQVEIYRLPTALANYVITHIDGGAIVGSANSICTITYQS
jgi:hypothetical protein